MGYTQFADFIHDSVPLVPAVPGSLVALYATGTSDIVATAADIQKYRNNRCGVILIDQSPSLLMFAAGEADVADVENGAGTFGTAAAGVAQRQAHGWQSTIYLSQENVIPQINALGNPANVFFGVANWNDSLATAEQALSASPNWAYVQYGDPNSNPNTVVPGTNITLRDCNADIDVAKDSFANQFLMNPPPPPPPPPPVPNQMPVPYRGHWLWIVPKNNRESMMSFANGRSTSVLGILKISSELLDHRGFVALNAYVIGKGVDEPMPAGMGFVTVNA